MHEENKVAEVVVSNNALFYGKCANPKHRLAQVATDEEVTKQETRKSFFAVCVKHSGSLILIGSDGSFSSKNSANPMFTKIARLLFDAWMGDRAESFIKYLANNKMSIGLELVVPHILSDHCEIPKLAYFAVTCVSDLKTGEHLSWDQLVQFCQDLGLPYGEYWFIPTNEAMHDAMALRAKIKADIIKIKAEQGANVSDTLALKSVITDLAYEFAGIDVPGNIPHQQVQGDLVEGCLVSHISVPADYPLLENINLTTVFEEKVKNSFASLAEETKWLRTHYETDCSDTGVASEAFWTKLDERLEEKGVNLRLPDKTGRRVSDKNFTWFKNQLEQSSSQEAKSLLANLSILQASSQKKSRRDLFKVTTYQQADGNYRVHLQITDDALLLESGLSGLKRGHVVNVQTSNESSSARNKEVMDYFENSKKVIQIRVTLKLKNDRYLVMRGKREASYLIERKLGQAKTIHDKSYEELQKNFLREFEYSLSPLFTEDDASDKQALFKREQSSAIQFFDFLLLEKYLSNKQIVKANPNDFIKSYFLKLYKKFTDLLSEEKEKLAEQVQQAWNAQKYPPCLVIVTALYPRNLKSVGPLRNELLKTFPDFTSINKLSDSAEKEANILSKPILFENLEKEIPKNTLCMLVFSDLDQMELDKKKKESNFAELSSQKQIKLFARDKYISAIKEEFAPKTLLSARSLPCAANQSGVASVLFFAPATSSTQARQVDEVSPSVRMKPN